MIKELMKVSSPNWAIFSIVPPEIYYYRCIQKMWLQHNSICWRLQWKENIFNFFPIQCISIRCQRLYRTNNEMELHTVFEDKSWQNRDDSISPKIYGTPNYHWWHYSWRWLHTILERSKECWCLAWSTHDNEQACQ